MHALDFVACGLLWRRRQGRLEPPLFVGIAATVEKVTDFKEMMALGVMSTPAIVIDRKVQCVGRVPAKKEILDWLTR